MASSHHQQDAHQRHASSGQSPQASSSHEQQQHQQRHHHHQPPTHHHHSQQQHYRPNAATRMMSGCIGGGGAARYAPLTPLQTLQRLEISKHRAEKALAATGHRDAATALDWLLAHAQDPTLDQPTRREYILYACPTGAFLEQLERFWALSRRTHGWNGAHNFVPHITLVSFFQAPDEYAPQLANALRLAVEMAAASSGTAPSLLDGRRPLALELSASDNFIGFYVRDGEAHDANMLQRLALQYVQNVKEVLGELISDKYEQLDALVTCFPWCGGVANTRCIPLSSRSISLEPHDNKLHLTLAYKFAADQYDALHAAAAAELDPNAATHWELRLYSRDPQLAAAASTQPQLQVHRVLRANGQPHGGGPIDDRDRELELRVGDLVYLNDCQSAAAATAGGHNGGNAYEPSSASATPTTTTAPTPASSGTSEWSQAISARTGCHGLVPPAHTERTAESDAWTLHETAQIAAPAPPAERPDVVYIRELIRKSTLCDLGHVNDADTLAAIARRRDVSETDAGGAADEAAPQQFYVLRHGERVDFTFGPDWHREAFDRAADNAYRARDLNMPPALPVRRGAPDSWAQDGPLTEMGRHQAWLTGRALRAAGVRLEHVYCSPAFRCVQTAAALLEGLGAGEECAIRVEPALFEWLVWYEGETLPEWMTLEELRAAGLKVDEAYVPTMTVAQLHERRAEECGEFYARNWSVAERAVRENATGNILCVGHAVTLDSCTRQLTTGRGRTYADMTRIMPSIAYASLVVAERQSNATATSTPTTATTSDSSWRLVAPPCHGMTHNRNSRFNWKVLLQPDAGDAA